MISEQADFMNVPILKVTKEELMKIAKETDRSLSAVVRGFINTGLAQRENQQRQMKEFLISKYCGEQQPIKQDDPA